MMMDEMKRGFTLAEVLITLGIIGVVAALTIPALITKYNKSVIETRLKKFYSTMEQAILLSEAENGDRMTWDYTDLNNQNGYDFFNRYFTKYIKTAKKVEPIDTAAGIYFADGSLMIFGKLAVHFYPYAADYEKLKDDNDAFIDSYGKKDFVFYFAPTNKNFTYHYKRGIEPYKVEWDGTKEKLLSSELYGCQETGSSSGRAYCTAIIQLNGWKIPDDYPLKF